MIDVAMRLRFLKPRAQSSIEAGLFAPSVEAPSTPLAPGQAVRVARVAPFGRRLRGGRLDARRGGSGGQLLQARREHQQVRPRESLVGISIS